MDLLARRGAMQTSTALSTEEIEMTAERLNGVSCIVCQPEDPRATVLYFHGGGYRLGSAGWSAGFGFRIAEVAGVRVVLVDYALAPESPFPSALHDATMVLDESRSRWPEPIAVAGDSAGAGLAAALVVAALRAGRQVPAGLILLSPWLDLTVLSSSYESRSATDRLFSKAQAVEASQLYLQGWDARDPLVSPLFAETQGFPPVLLSASTDEVLLEDSLGLTASLARSAVPVTAHFVPEMEHAWPTISPQRPESSAVLQAMATFLASLA